MEDRSKENIPSDTHRIKQKKYRRANLLVTGVLREETGNWAEELFEEILSLKNTNIGY